MKDTVQATAKTDQKTAPKQHAPKDQRWGVAHKARLPHKVGLPLGSGGCGDGVER